jgi:hypothetical protein
MKLRLALATFLVILSVSVLSTQATVVRANTISVNALTAPVVTPPVTSITKAISGNVTFKFLGWFRGITNQDKVKPAANVKIEAKNIFTKETFVTVTDSNGNYVLQAPSGKYLISAKYNKVPFSPGARFVNLTTDKSGFNFQGYTK